VSASSGNDFGAALQQTPNVGFIGTGFPGNNSISVRGVGGLATFGPFDASVSVTIDEVPVPIRSFDTLLLDAERVELLKGPQGTLYGRSSLNGSLNIVTRQPTNVWTAAGRIEGGEHGYTLASVSAGGAVVPDRFLVRAAVQYTKFNGDIPNLLTIANNNTADIFAGRITGRWLISDASSLTLAYQADREERNIPGALLRSDPRFPLSGEDVLSEGSRDTDRVTLRLDQELGDITLSLVGGYERSDVRNSFDLTDSLVIPVAFGIPAAFLNDPSNDKSRTDTDEESISLEARLQSAGDSALNWTLGASYLELSLTGTSRVAASFHRSTLMKSSRTGM
jgi:iron complex outermembrane receptor protein